MRRNGAWGPGQHGHRGRWRPMGCLFLLFGLFAAGTLVVGLWAGAAILGLVEAPGVVVAAGIVAFIVIGIGAVAAARAFRGMTRPLDELIAASARIEAGDYSVRVGVSGSRETRSLGRAFNQMGEHLQASDQRRRGFLADVTHELRTPLTVLQGQLEAIDDGIYELDRERIAGLLLQTRAMSGLVEDLHTISLAEVGGLRLSLITTDLDDLIDEVVATYATAAQLAGVQLSAVPSRHEVRASIDAAATRRILGNLVTNALRHTPDGGSIELGAHRDEAGARLEVRDSGSGMDADLASKAFERFEKGPDSDGSGLGLAIAKDLVEAQLGVISIRSEPGRGTTVTIVFPLSDEQLELASV